MDEFNPVYEDLELFNELKTKIDTIKNDTIIEIEESLIAKNNKIKYKKEIKECMKFFIIFFIIIILGLSFTIYYNLSLISICLGIFAALIFVLNLVIFLKYLDSDLDFENKSILINLSKISLNKEELKLISKFMDKNMFEKILSDGGLKISLNVAKNVLESEEYQRHYNEKMARKIVEDLSL